MKNVLIAGGTGLIGQRLQELLTAKGHIVSVLTRKPQKVNEFYWDPAEKKIDAKAFVNVQVLINLSGAGIADSKWTAARKKELYDSRIGANEFLFAQADKIPQLEQFISSSGINAYGYDDGNREHVESDAFGKDYLSDLVRQWEESADLFRSKCKVAKIRTAVVLDPKGGALARMKGPINAGIGSPLGSGEQQMPWIHYEDLVRIFQHVIDQQMEGAFNVVTSNASNKEFMKTMATVLKKPFFFPKVPSFVLKILFGEMADMLLKGAKGSNQLIRSTGYEFVFSDLEKALKDVLKG
ncbi:MAG: TIGR01777 family oxidoreductase [Flavobacteriia bacterium]